MRLRVLGIIAVLSTLMLVFGCGGDDGSSPDPVTGVDIAADKAEVEIGHSTGINATVSGGGNKSLTWFVNDIENGNSEWGTLTGSSPVTYNAPDALPSPRTVVIKAVSVSDTSKVDTCRVALQFTKMFVDSATGDDDTATGCINLPYRTITEARKQAEDGMTILVRPGTYSDAAGETFPIYLKNGVSLVGEDWEQCILVKETPEFDATEGIRPSHNVTVRKITIRDATPPGDARFYNALYLDTANLLIDSVRIFERSRYSCIRVNGATDAVIQNCVLDVTGDPTETKGMNRGFEITADDQGTIIRNCTLSGFGTGLFFNGLSDALVEDCVFENCDFGAKLCCYSDPGHTPTPDFGGGNREGAGGNLFRSYSECGFYNGGGGTAYAKFNTWHNDPPVIGFDYCVYGDGSVTVIE